MLAVFEKCSGLKINQSKSEVLWLGSNRFCKDKILNLTLRDEPILALAVYFSYVEKNAEQKTSSTSWVLW